MAVNPTNRTARAESPQALRSLLKDEAKEALALLLEADADASRPEWDREYDDASQWPASTDNFGYRATAE